MALEGIDGAGTSTQAAALCRRLEGRGQAVHVTAEPSRLAIGRLIRACLRQVDRPPNPAMMALLFAADRVDHVRQEIEPARAQGKHVITDRYVLSSLVYQSLECPLEWVAEINRMAPAPDITFLLRVPADLAAKRRATRGGKTEIYDSLSIQRRLVDRYDEIVAARPDLRVHVLDGTMPEEAVSDAIEALLVPLLGRAVE